MPTLTFSMQVQEQNKWCWAATSVSTHLFYNGNRWNRQCDLVNHELDQTDCCQNTKSCKCNQVWFLPKAMNTTGNLSHYSEGAVNWNILESVIDKGCPLGVQIAWKGTGAGHCLIVSGYISASQMVIVNDPDPRRTTRAVSYATLKNNYEGKGTWIYSYFTKAE